MSLTPASLHHLGHDLETIGRWADLLPIDTSRSTIPTSSTIHAIQGPQDPCDLDAIEHSQTISLAEAIIASTTEYWLCDQPGYTLPTSLNTATNQQLETTQARCLILRHNLETLATQPNIDQISYDIARGATSIEWARDQGRLADPRHAD
jgi:hypothetical protein